MAAEPDSASEGEDPEPTARSPEPGPGAGRLSHVSRATGRAPGASAYESRMVDVTAKSETERQATARARVRFPAGSLETVLRGGGPKGPVTEVARTAGILAAKRTSEWIPLCHPLPLNHVEITFEPVEPDVLEVRCRVGCTGRTGVEMEALVGASAAALTVYDMTKALDHGIVIEAVELLEKLGGKSGAWRRPGGAARGAPRA